MRYNGRAALSVISSLAVVLTLLSPGFASPKTAKPAAKHSGTPAPVTAIVPFAGPCDTANIIDLLTDLEAPDNKPDKLSVLQGRINECSSRIAGILAAMPSPTPAPFWVSNVHQPPALPTPPPVCATPPPPATSASVPVALYETLSSCVGYLTYLTSVPSPDPSASPLPRVASRPTFYVYAVGAYDAAAASVLIRSVVARLTKSLSPQSDLVVTGRADWTTNDNFAAQCQLDPNTRDALVIQNVIPQTSTLNYLLVTSAQTRVSASIEMLGCSSEDHNPGSSPLSLLSENDIGGKAHQTALTIGIFASLVPFLIPSKSVTSVNLGPPAVITNTQQSAPQASGNAAGYFNDQNLNLPAQNASVQLTVASERLAGEALHRLHGFCDASALQHLLADAGPRTPIEHRTVVYKAAFLFKNDCTVFGGFL
jgi:hypothetical protein